MTSSSAGTTAATSASARARVCQKPKFTFEEVNARALPVLPLILARVLPGGRMNGREYIVRNPRRADNSPGSFSINTRSGKWSDFATGDRGGDVISLIAYLKGVRQPEALEAVARMVGLA